jgi:xylulokinase
MTEPLLLGVDLGMSRVKCGLFTFDGRERGFAARLLSARQRGDAVPYEHDAELWWRAARDTIRECLAADDGHAVAAVCVGGQGPTLVAVDAAGYPTYRALTFSDRRSEPEAASVSERLGRKISVRSSYLPRALWIRDQEPKAYRDTRWFLQAWDFVVLRLTGVAAATAPPVEAYIPWQSADLTTIGLDPVRFPQLVPSGSVVGQVSPAGSAQTELTAGVPVVAGGNDFLLGTMGVAGARKGLAQSQGGTTGACTLCWDCPLAGGAIAWSIPSPVEPGLYNVGGPLTTAGAALDWVIRDALDLTDYTNALEGAASVDAAADGLLFYPYLAGEPLATGSNTRGAFVGLSLRHRAPHLVRAVLEGVAFAGRTIIDSLAAAGGCVSEVVSFGGQVRSSLWNQIKSDIWNRPLDIPEVEDAGCLGAAAIATVGIGAYGSLGEASRRMARVGHRFLPDPERAALYSRLYEAYSAMQPALEPVFERLGTRADG